MADSEVHSKYDQNFARDAGDWIDDQVHGGLQSGFRSGLEVLSSGFGKGFLTTAGIFAAAVLVASVAAPGVVFGKLFADITVAQSVEYALPTIGNWLLGTGAGWGLLAAGGATGSLVSAWSENNRINKESAECQAARYAQAREAGAQEQMPEQMQALCTGLSEGHCARLLREQALAQQQGAAR